MWKLVVAGIHLLTTKRSRAVGKFPSGNCEMGRVGLLVVAAGQGNHKMRPRLISSKSIAVFIGQRDSVFVGQRVFRHVAGVGPELRRGLGLDVDGGGRRYSVSPTTTMISCPESLRRM